jgi:hypothetical protein
VPLMAALAPINLVLRPFLFAGAMRFDAMKVA